MREIRTERQRLVALTREQLSLYLAAPRKLERQLGFPVSRRIVTDRVRRAIGMKLAKMSLARRDSHLWVTYWLIVVHSLTGDGEFGAGLLGFKGCPDRNGEVEIGYGIDPDYQNKGHTTEAVRAMIAWAFQDPQCTSVIAPNTQRTNLASNRVLAKVGMRVYAETDDALFWRIDKENPKM